MNRVLRLLLCGVIVLYCVLSGFASAEIENGVFEACAKGNNADVKVTVTIDQGSIISIEVGEHAETSGICDLAIERIPKAIVNGQTLAVDTVSGATNTSKAIIEAVKQCIIIAGGDPEMYMEKAVDKTALTESSFDADVIVVGSGISGVSAALGAAEEGAHVIVFEKQAILGGSSGQLNPDAFIGVYGAKYAIENIDNTVDAAYNRIMGYANIDSKQSGFPLPEKLRPVLEGAEDNISWLESNGLVFSDPMYMLNSIWKPVSATNMDGHSMMETLTQSARNKGIEFITECRVTDLIIEDGKIIGVKANDGLVSAHAKSVILACGGFAYNQEMMEKYAPGFVGSYCISSPSNTGDGYVLASQAGAAFYENPWVLAITPRISDEFLAIVGGASDVRGEPAINYQKGLAITAQGKRFVNETLPQSMVSNEMAWECGGQALYLYDSSNEVTAKAIEQGIALGEAYKGETLEDLAKYAGIDAIILTNTVEDFNSYVKSGKDEVFGKDPQYMLFLEKGPYYAVKFYCQYGGTFGGAVTNENMQVLNAQGEVIPGLYAVGEMSNRAFYNYGYLGSSLQFSSQTGHIAGVNAAR